MSTCIECLKPFTFDLIKSHSALGHNRCLDTVEIKEQQQKIDALEDEIAALENSESDLKDELAEARHEIEYSLESPGRVEEASDELTLDY